MPYNNAATAAICQIERIMKTSHKCVRIRSPVDRRALCDIIGPHSDERVLQRGKRCAVAVRGFRVPRGRSDARRSSCEMRPFLSPVSSPRTVTPPMRPLFPLRDTSTLCREQSGGESSVHQAGVPRTPFPGGCAFVAGISIDYNEVSRFWNKLAAEISAIPCATPGLFLPRS